MLYGLSLREYAFAYPTWSYLITRLLMIPSACHLGTTPLPRAVRKVTVDGIYSSQPSDTPGPPKFNVGAVIAADVFFAA